MHRTHRQIDRQTTPVQRVRQLPMSYHSTRSDAFSVIVSAGGSAVQGKKSRDSPSLTVHQRPVHITDGQHNQHHAWLDVSCCAAVKQSTCRRSTITKCLLPFYQPIACHRRSRKRSRGRSRTGLGESRRGFVRLLPRCRSKGESGVGLRLRCLLCRSPFSRSALPSLSLSLSQSLSRSRENGLVGDCGMDRLRLGGGDGERPCEGERPRRCECEE